jgi:hypothetical protein
MGVLEIGVARACVAGDDSVVATYTVGAGSSSVDGHDMTRQSRLGTRMMTDGVGDNDEAWHGMMAQAEKVDRVTEGRTKMR